ncbi:hypothetical protein HOG48_06060 [Candidatus Peregrinibacteria bacterium]|jgi:hypothetical protein|nr:hypothetical protein [Candidatus Peregrinibacteria bacterium]
MSSTNSVSNLLKERLISDPLEKAMIALLALFEHLPEATVLVILAILASGCEDQFNLVTQYEGPLQHEVSCVPYLDGIATPWGSESVAAACWEMAEEAREKLENLVRASSEIGTPDETINLAVNNLVGVVACECRYGLNESLGTMLHPPLSAQWPEHSSGIDLLSVIQQRDENQQVTGIWDEDFDNIDDLHEALPEIHAGWEFNYSLRGQVHAVPVFVTDVYPLPAPEDFPKWSFMDDGQFPSADKYDDVECDDDKLSADDQGLCDELEDMPWSNYGATIWLEDPENPGAAPVEIPRNEEETE